MAAHLPLFTKDSGTNVKFERTDSLPQKGVQLLDPSTKPLIE